MSKLTEFDMSVLNKEIVELSYEELKEVLEDCAFRSATVDLYKLQTLIETIDYAPEEKRSKIWEELKTVIGCAFAKATIQISPRYFVCETPAPVEEGETSPKKRKTTKK